jgi:cytosine/adenosine deaminase-related metal-dependent hydrolase
LTSIHIRHLHHLAPLSAAGTGRSSNADLLLRDGRIAAVGSRSVADPDTEVLDAPTCVALPGLVNTHHHLFQTLTRNVPAVQNAKLFDWLVGLYEIWKFVDAEDVYWSTLLGCAELLLTGCTTTSDHHYLFPRGAPAELLDAQIEAARTSGIRFHATRGSMSLGRSRGGLPPDDVVQDEDAILADCERVIARHHDATPLAMLRVGLAPCAPFSVSEALMIETIRLARRHKLQAHTHLAETQDEIDYCLEQHGRRPLQLMADLEWLGPDVWFAHGVHFTDAELEQLAATRTGITHCPSSNMRLASGMPRVRDMLQRGVAVGLGVDGSASNDTSDMLAEVRQALLLSRNRDGAGALDAETALGLATRGGAQLLGRSAEIGSLEVGKAADVVLFDLDRIDRAGALSDPLAALVFTGFDHRVHTSIVNGRVVVRDGHLVHLDETEIARKANERSFRLLRRAGVDLPWGMPSWLER